ncbi:MAG TPA: DNA polymerase ligase N-terminal domain-containing protein [Rhizomicrobium sp.]|jgi:bifunctional non-homologous end joining protein LigD|nr:DNA polymerase ligase N-terminal domain-containing protein [Rhizomicrobium sp.]
MARLSLYNKKRDFTVTKEPPGKIGRAKGNRFVIQRHAATRLHYDLRLELDGVYKSWAVTKVPSVDPAVKRLAVEVEDHPLDYGTFEGTIPGGEYGGGTVQLWDRGTWAPKLDQSVHEDLRNGHLKIELDGERMHGGWALIRLREKDKYGRPSNRPSRNWLLIKEKDAAAMPGEEDALLAADTSVKTGRTLEEIAANKKSAVWHSNRGDAAEARAKTNDGSKKKTRKRTTTAPRKAPVRRRAAR